MGANRRFPKGDRRRSSVFLPFGRLRRGETPALTRGRSMQKSPTQSRERVKGRRPLRSPEAAPLASPPSQPPRIRADCAEQIDTEPHHHQRNVEDRRAPALRLQGENRHIHPRQHIQQVAVAELEAAQRLVADDNHQVRPDYTLVLAPSLLNLN